MDTETEKKQSFLKENILEAGYDPQSFADFMENERDDGCNIDNWTLDELYSIISKFKKKYTLVVSEDRSIQALQPTDRRSTSLFQAVAEDDHQVEVKPQEHDSIDADADIEMEPRKKYLILKLD